MKILLIDNYDSFTYNIKQLVIAAVNVSPTIIKNDATYYTVSDFSDYDAIIISPGPGSPTIKKDVGFTEELISNYRIPVLGICLGHQIIGSMFGGRIIKLDYPKHGHISKIEHVADSIFDNIPSVFDGVRYHSYAVQLPPKTPLQILATSRDDGVIMALRHNKLPFYGVQYHPESYYTQYGIELLQNFLMPFKKNQHKHALKRYSANVLELKPKSYQLIYKTLGYEFSISFLLETIFRDATNVIWLDSARVSDSARFSYLIVSNENNIEKYEYFVSTKITKITKQKNIHYNYRSILELIEHNTCFRLNNLTKVPFNFHGGFVGYLGYEMKSEFGCAANQHESSYPDALFIKVNNYIVIDHQEKITYIVGLNYGSAQDNKFSNWVNENYFRLKNCIFSTNLYSSEDNSDFSKIDNHNKLPAVKFPVSKTAYMNMIKTAQDKLKLGESYEICLTNNIHIDPVVARKIDLNLYKKLRKANPTSYAAYIKIINSDALQVLCTSPEKFLKTTSNGLIETSPIKGTIARDNNELLDKKLKDILKYETKYFSENLMILDLLRNDLTKIAQANSVKVTNPMQVESYSTVHQLVSTITALIQPNINPVAIIKSCFPGGSMTGAPKLRTVDIIDNLEIEARGIYSGCIGYIGLDGLTEFNIVIRTIVGNNKDITIGSGGAITIDSIATLEHEEMLLKINKLVEILIAS